MAEPDAARMFEDAHFDGADYVPERDDVRLRGQIRRVFDVVSDGKWHTLEGISRITKDPPASISAQLRHLRKERFGAYTIDRRHMGNGLYEYRLGVEDNGGV